MTPSVVRTRPGRARPIMLAALLTGAAGIVVQIIAGVHYGAVPPGLIILVVAAGLVAFVPWRWTPAPVVAIAAFIFVGGFTSANGKHALAHPDEIGAFVGFVMIMGGLAVAMAAGVAAVVIAARRRPSEALPAVPRARQPF